MPQALDAIACCRSLQLVAARARCSTWLQEMVAARCAAINVAVCRHSLPLCSVLDASAEMVATRRVLRSTLPCAASRCRSLLRSTFLLVLNA